MGIRNAAKVIILIENKILLIKYKNEIGAICWGIPTGGIYYTLPGGGQNIYETIEEAAVRECREETGYEIKIGRLAAVCEEITVNAEFRRLYPDHAHKLHFIFTASVTDETPGSVTEPDFGMTGLERADIKNIKNYPLYPEIVKNNIESIINSESVLYLGSERTA